jgi:hypothetical protein
MENLTIWIAISKSGQVLLFTDEPERKNDGWIGSYYVNSAVYENVLNLVGKTSMTFDNDPEPIILEVKK